MSSMFVFLESPAFRPVEDVKKPHHHSDNRRVLNGRQSCEYLCIGENEETAESVFLYRYFVPGRCDVYGFGLQSAEPGRSQRVTYWSESDIPMERSFAALLKDLEKPGVVDMFARFARSSKYHVAMLRFLELLAPRATAVKVFRRASNKRMKEWRAKRDSERAAGARSINAPATASAAVVERKGDDE